MSASPVVRSLLYLAIVALYVLHNDLWLWDDARIVLGLPVGLLYHVVYCAAAIGLMVLLVHYAWPAEYDDDEEGVA